MIKTVLYIPYSLTDAMIVQSTDRSRFFYLEVAISPAAVSIKLIYRLLIRAFSDVEKPFLFSDFAGSNPPNQKIIEQKVFSTSEKARITWLIVQLHFSQLFTSG